jgi:phospholipid/cholesterol/gamma-HCH transport system substrate-binding protein
VKAIRDHLRDFVAMIVLAVIALVVGAYILSNQRLRFPIVEPKPVQMKAEFSTAQAVTPGQGQTVRVSGVRIGDVGQVELKNGRAIVGMDIDKEYASMVRTNATALLRPKTALKDMFIELDPGSEPAPVAEPGFTIPVANTAPDVNLDEILAMLDDDTRDYLKLLVGGAARGLDGRGEDLRDVFKRFEPTHRDLARVSEKVAERHTNLRRLVRSLNVLNTELGRRDDDLAGLVDGSARVFRAFASQDTNITEAVDHLPGALEQTTDTLQRVERFANILGPAAERLREPARKLDDVNEALIPLAREGTPLLRDRIRPFVREARPLVRDLRPAARRLARGTPDLTRSFVVLNNLFNLIGYNPRGREGPEDPNRQEGYLFWIAWLGHNGGALFSSADHGGIFRPVSIQASCASLFQTIGGEPELAFLGGLTGALADSRICPDQSLGSISELLEGVPAPTDLPELRRRGASDAGGEKDGG